MQWNEESGGQEIRELAANSGSHTDWAALRKAVPFSLSFLICKVSELGLTSVSLSSEFMDLCEHFHRAQLVAHDLQFEEYCLKVKFDFLA